MSNKIFHALICTLFAGLLVSAFWPLKAQAANQKMTITAKLYTMTTSGPLLTEEHKIEGGIVSAATCTIEKARLESIATVLKRELRNGAEFAKLWIEYAVTCAPAGNEKPAAQIPNWDAYVVRHDCMPLVEPVVQPKYGLTIKATPAAVVWSCADGSTHYR